jgi:hypothetical protein
LVRVKSAWSRFENPVGDQCLFHYTDRKAVEKGLVLLNCEAI